MKKAVFFFANVLYTTSLFATTKLTLETKTISEINNTPKYEIKISFPQIKSATSDSEKNFNNVAKKWALKKTNEFKKTLDNWQTSNLPPDIKAKGSYMTVTYDLYTVAPKKIISLRYKSNSFLAGAAHGSNVYGSINYDLICDRKLALSDLFRPNSNYLKIIADLSLNKVTEKLAKEANGQVNIFKEGLMPNSKNFQVWNLTPQGLMFTFNEYQVAPYVFGPQEVIIPYKRLSSKYNTGNCSNT